MAVQVSVVAGERVVARIIQVDAVVVVRYVVIEDNTIICVIKIYSSFMMNRFLS